MTSRRGRGGERGNISILVAAAVVVGGLLCVAIGRVGDAATLQARADAAADAAALAAADQLALGQGTSAATARARAVARENGAKLVSCACAGSAAEIVVAFDRARGHARAEVDRSASDAMRPSRVIAPALSRYTFQLPHAAQRFCLCSALRRLRRACVVATVMDDAGPASTPTGGTGLVAFEYA
jgi:secretion/DNA translocation related TadE-like protein